MMTAHTKPEKSNPLAILAPTLMLAEKNVNPSMMTNIARKFFLDVFGTGSKE